MLSNSILSYGVLEDIPITEIKLPVNQLRSELDLDELSLSIAQKGLLQPIIVRTLDSRTFYEIVAGCRRYLACKKIGRRKITCQIANLSDKEAFEISIIENVQRMTLTALDEARAFKNYVSDYGWGGVSDLAAKLGKSVSYVTKKIMLLNLPKEIKDSLNEQTLSTSTAFELAYLKKEEDRTKIAKLIKNRHLTTNKVRKIVKKMNDSNEIETDIEKLYIDAGIRNKAKLEKSFDKTIITLRIAMNRMGPIIDDVEDDWIIHEILMQHKRRLHDQIDVLIKQRKKMK